MAAFCGRCGREKEQANKRGVPNPDYPHKCDLRLIADERAQDLETGEWVTLKRTVPRSPFPSTRKLYKRWVHSSRLQPGGDLT